MRKKIIVAVASLFVAVLISLFTVRNSIIRDCDWKVTSGANLKNDFICFSEDSVYSYCCPFIREKGDLTAIALFQFEGRLIVFSTEEKAFSILMYI